MICDHRSVLPSPALPPRWRRTAVAAIARARCAPAPSFLPSPCGVRCAVCVDAALGRWHHDANSIPSLPVPPAEMARIRKARKGAYRPAPRSRPRQALPLKILAILYGLRAASAPPAQLQSPAAQQGVGRGQNTDVEDGVAPGASSVAVGTCSKPLMHADEQLSRVNAVLSTSRGQPPAVRGSLYGDYTGRYSTSKVVYALR